MLADVWAVMTLAVLRPRHAQRSRLTDIRAEGLVGTAFRGKLEVNAVYQWTLPSRGVTNCELATRFWERWFAVMGRISPDGPIACLLPAATIPRGKGFAAATSWEPRAMSVSSLVRHGRALFVAPHWNYQRRRR